MVEQRRLSFLALLLGTLWEEDRSLKDGLLDTRERQGQYMDRNNGRQPHTRQIEIEPGRPFSYALPREAEQSKAHDQAGVHPGISRHTGGKNNETMLRYGFKCISSVLTPHGTGMKE